MRAGLRMRLEVASLLMGLALTATCSHPDTPPSLVLITIDTLRSDHLSIHGYRRATAPRLESLAAHGVVFDNVISAIPETAPALACLLTGQWPARLGIRGNGHPLENQFTTLAERLSQAGYDTAAFVSGFPLISRLSGLNRGFQHYDDEMPDPRGSVSHVQRSARKTTDAALVWLAGRHARPFFLWVHYYDPHGDYAPTPPYDSLFPPHPSGPSLDPKKIPAYQRLDGSRDAAVYVARYDGEIRQVDDQMRRLLASLEQSGDLNRAIIAVTADHGESLTEHHYLFDHGNELYMPSLHIPLILAGPGLPGDGRHLSGLVRTPDIMPTLLDLLALPQPDVLGGLSLGPRLSDQAPDRGHEAFSEARFQPYRALISTDDVQPKLAVRDDRFTVILRLRTATVELYDRLTDPAEQRNLLPPLGAGQRQELQTHLAEALRLRLRALMTGVLPDPVVINPALRTRLDQIASGMAPP